MQQDDQPIVPISGRNLNVSASAIGAQGKLRVTIQYQGAGVLALSAPQLSEANGFSILETQATSWTLAPGNGARFVLAYTASSGAAVLNTLSLFGVERKPDETMTSAALTFQVTGTAPSFTIHYAMSTDGNNILVTSGTPILFPSTAASTGVSAAISVTNTGTAPGIVNSVRIGGSSYQLQNLPVIPATVAPGNSLRFNVRFVPSGAGPAAGQLSISLPGSEFSSPLQANATGTSIGYELVLPDATTEVIPGGPLSFPSTEVGKTSKATLRVKNSGTADSQIAAVTVSGAPFAITSAPVLPLTLRPGDSADIGLEFAPTEGGAATGDLRVGSDTFQLTGSALASQITISYRGSTVAANATLFLPPVQVGNSVETEVILKNEGTLTTSVRGVQLSQNLPELSLIGLPDFPTEIAPGASIPFKMAFSPRNTEVVTTVLRIDDVTFSISGSGTAPPALPAVKFGGTSGETEPLQQPAITLSLSEPYSLPLKGVLTLTAVSDSFAEDPSVQFATGGRTVPFRIPANSTQAIFGSGSTAIRLQTGSIAESIVLTPAFSLEGGYDLTPASAPTHTLQVPRSAPRILQMQVTNANSNSFVLAITGMATGRAINQLTFQLQPVAGTALSATQFTVDVRSAFDLWFNNPQSQAYGSLFSFSAPFTLNIPTSTGALSQYLDSVSATLTNADGTSNESRVSFR